MFDSLTDRLGGILERLKKRGALREDDVVETLREIRVVLLEADVALPVVKDFIGAVRERAVGQEVLRSVNPAQMVIKVVHDHLVDMLGTEDAEIDLHGTPPAAVLMIGLQGSGKTTTAAKLGLRLKERDRRKVLLVSLDIYRPAAQEQLAALARQAGLPALPIILGEQPLAIAGRAMDVGRRESYDVVVMDTAGRLHIDQDVMAEVARVRAVARPTETLLIADALTGQDAVNLAREFHEKVGVTGIVLTRADGDARGGAALSMKAVTGCPIKLLGVGEKLDALEPFQAERIAGRILGMGDIVGLVEKAARLAEEDEAEERAAKLLKGRFTLDDMADQLRQLRSMGDAQGLLGMLPGAGKIRKQIAETQIDGRTIGRQEAIILSMTAAERRNPKLLNGSRRRRIAAGSGTSVQEVNRLFKQYRQMGAMIKGMGKVGKKGLLRGGLPSGMMPPFA